MLGCDDPLDRRPRRVAVAGVTGSGKTTASRRIAAVIGAAHTEIDSLFHGPGWTPRPTFAEDVATLVGEDAWVVEWQYPAARELVVDRCDALVWLDHPFWTVTFPRVIRRTIRRRIRREVLWNGNAEQPLWRVLVDRSHIIRWAIGTRSSYRELVPDASRRHPDVIVVRLRTPAELDVWIAGPLTAACSTA